MFCSFNTCYYLSQGGKVLCGGGYVEMPGNLSGGCYWKPCILGKCFDMNTLYIDIKKSNNSDYLSALFIRLAICAQ